MAKVKLYIPEAVYDKVMHWVKSTTIEVSGFGKVIRREDGDFEILDAYLIKQEGGSAHTDIDGTALAKLMYTTREAPGELRWWWHSHVNMQVFWSGTDKETILELGANGWTTATVFNKREETRSALCYRAHETVKTVTPWGTVEDESKDPVFIDDIDLMILVEPKYDAETIESWNKEFTDNVTEKKWTTFTEGVGWSQQPLLNGGADPKPPILNSGVVMSDEDLETWGMYGYGVGVEAKALNMHPNKYRQIIIDGPKHRDFARVSKQLNDKFNSGVLDKIEKELLDRGRMNGSGHTVT